MSFTFIIQFKYDSEDRLRNLLRGVIYLNYHFKNKAEILIIDQDNNKDYLTEILASYGVTNINIKSYNIEGPYNRSKIINKGIEEANNDICFIYDCDILIPKEQIELSVEFCDKRYQLVCPYTNPQYNIPQDYFNEFHLDYNFKEIQYKIKPYQIQHRHIEDNYPLIAYASGFSIVVNKKTLGNLVYFNEEFNGWGFEDTEYFFRMDFFNIKMTRIYGPIFHVEHDRTIQNQYPEYTHKNSLLYNKLKNMNKEDLVNYYKFLNFI
jgi:predicted glycosyltransferase involved in capsule biosynthesis